MGQRLPTREGDVVIAHRRSAPSEYQVWLVIEDGQQARDGRVFRPMQVRDQETAVQLASEFVSDTGTIFVLDQDSNNWTKIPR